MHPWLNNKWKPLIFFFVLCLLTAGGPVACSSTRAQMGIWSGMNEEVVVVSADGTVSKGSVSHPYVFQVSSNRLAVNYCPSKSLESWVGEMAAPWPAYSDDGGKTWQHGDPMNWAAGSPPILTSVTTGQYVANTEDPSGGFFNAFTVMSNGNRFGACKFLIFKNKASEWLSVGARSYGENLWYGPFQVRFDLTGFTAEPQFIYLPPRGIEISDGKIGLPVYAMVDRKYQTLFFTSEDGGSNFVFKSVVATTNDAPWGDAGPCEAGITIFPDGEIFCIMRTTGGGYGSFSANMVEARSRDGGLTWKTRRSSLQGVIPTLVRGKGDRVYCLYGRPGNQIAISNNRGRSWGSEIGVTEADYNTSGYLDGLMMEDGTLLVVYDQWGRSRKKIWLWEPPPAENLILSRRMNLQ
jgi:BNR repeat-like domain/BNR/Asp-box repeat